MAETGPHQLEEPPPGPRIGVHRHAGTAFDAHQHRLHRGTGHEDRCRDASHHSRRGVVRHLHRHRAVGLVPGTRRQSLAHLALDHDEHRPRSSGASSRTRTPPGPPRCTGDSPPSTHAHLVRRSTCDRPQRRPEQLGPVQGQRIGLDHRTPRASTSCAEQGHQTAVDLHGGDAGAGLDQRHVSAHPGRPRSRPRDVPGPTPDSRAMRPDRVGVDHEVLTQGATGRAARGSSSTSRTWSPRERHAPNGAAADGAGGAHQLRRTSITPTRRLASWENVAGDRSMTRPGVVRLAVVDRAADRRRRWRGR